MSDVVLKCESPQSLWSVTVAVALSTFAATVAGFQLTGSFDCACAPVACAPAITDYYFTRDPSDATHQIKFGEDDVAVAVAPGLSDDAGDEFYAKLLPFCIDEEYKFNNSLTRAFMCLYPYEDPKQTVPYLQLHFQGSQVGFCNTDLYPATICDDEFGGWVELFSDEYTPTLRNDGECASAEGFPPADPDNVFTSCTKPQLQCYNDGNGDLSAFILKCNALQDS